MGQLLGPLPGDQEAIDGFCRMTAGVVSPAVFLAEENVGRILAGAS